MPSLAISGTRVIQALASHDLYVLRVIHTPTLSTCPKCNVERNLMQFSKVEKIVADTPMHGLHVRLQLEQKRYRCQACGATSLHPLPWLHPDRQATRRLVAAIEGDCLFLPNIQTAHRYGVDDKTVKGIQDSLIQRLEQERVLETPEWLGIDEIYIRNKPRAVFTDTRQGLVIELLEDRNKTTVIGFLQMLDAGKVKLVTMDMWRPYRNAVREVLPRATVVVDKFHVVRLANRALERVRLDHYRGWSAERRGKLRSNRFTLLRRRKKLTEAEVMKIDAWHQNTPELIDAYKLKERFFGIYDASTALEARSRYARWLKSVPEPLRARGGPWYELVTAMGNWEPEIMAYFTHRATNAYAESANRVIRDIDRGGNGYSFQVLRARAIYGQMFGKKDKLASQAKRARTAFDGVPLVHIHFFRLRSQAYARARARAEMIARQKISSEASDLASDPSEEMTG